MAVKSATLLTVLVMLMRSVEGASSAYFLNCTAAQDGLGYYPSSTFFNVRGSATLCGYSVTGNFYIPNSNPPNNFFYTLMCVDNLAADAIVLAVDSTQLFSLPPNGIALRSAKDRSGAIYSNVTCSCLMTLPSGGLYPTNTSLIYFGGASRC